MKKNTKKTKKNIDTRLQSRLRMEYDINQAIKNDEDDEIKKLLGKGDWGNVVAVKTNYGYYVLKITKLKKIPKIIDYTNYLFSELWILKEICSELIKRGICPNLPLLYDYFLSKECSFLNRENKLETVPALITMVEYAKGDLELYLQKKRTDEELMSCLFQIMIGLHCIQIFGQIINNDIKLKNILFYKTKGKGSWLYIIGNKKYYIPDYGVRFVINDFGVSYNFSPNFQLYSHDRDKYFNLGSRFGINMNGVFSPLLTKKDSKSKIIRWETNLKDTIKTYANKIYLNRKTGQIEKNTIYLSKYQKKFLYSRYITTDTTDWNFYLNPYIIPPFEFYNDIQDTIRMFTGGSRTTQSGNHYRMSGVTQNFINRLNKIKGKSMNSNSNTFSILSNQILAGEFIKTFYHNLFSSNCRKKIIETYNIDRCLRN